MAPRTRDPDDSLLVLHGIAHASHARQCPIAIVVDTGCDTSCMPYSVAAKLGLQTWRKRHTVYASLADGSLSPMTHEARLKFRVGSYESTVVLDLTKGSLSPQDMLLGMEWMRKVNPEICFRPLSFKVMGVDGREHELIGVRPPGRPYYCADDGYDCPRSRNDRHLGGSGWGGNALGRGDDGGMGRYGMDELFRGMGGGRDGWGRGDFGYAPMGPRMIPAFRHVGKSGSPVCTRDASNPDAEQGNKTWVDWRKIFPDRPWYSSGHQDGNTELTMVRLPSVHPDTHEDSQQAAHHDAFKGNIRSRQAKFPTTQTGKNRLPFESSAAGTKGFLPARESKVTPGKYDLFR